MALPPYEKALTRQAADSFRVFLVGLVLPFQPVLVVEENLEELEELAKSIGMKVVGREFQRRQIPDARTLIGTGKVAEIGRGAAESGADLVVFDDDLTPNQVKNLEAVIHCAVIDRSALILELFLRQARTREARTQVELAKVEYDLPRLTRRWTHLSRQVGGIGVRGGEGETQLEVDRRILRNRLKRLKKDLSRIEQTRRLHRRGRQGMPMIAFAGYTNAGKSTLFNRITRASVRAENRLFATLDSRVRKGHLGGARLALFTDTVGFIRKLPHHLIASFRSTLEEFVEADIILHVVDRSHPRWREQKQIGERVLVDLGVEMSSVFPVFNKSDQCHEVLNEVGSAQVVSAKTGDGIKTLKEDLIRLIDARGLW